VISAAGIPRCRNHGQLRAGHLPVLCDKILMTKGRFISRAVTGVAIGPDGRCGRARRRAVRRNKRDSRFWEKDDSRVSSGSARSWVLPEANKSNYSGFEEATKPTKVRMLFTVSQL
jgi:hypothetical protein